jgi:hypothetical protein
MCTASVNVLIAICRMGRHAARAGILMLRLYIALLLVIATNAGAWAAGHLMPSGLRVPLDGGAILADGERILGNHKTWGGLIVGTIACSFVTMLLRHSFLMGAIFGLLSLAGDCGSSFVKRRLHFPTGAEVPGLDQLPEAMVPLLVLRRPLGLSLAEAAVIAVVFLLLDLAVVTFRHRTR